MKNGLILYYEYGEHFALLSDEELGQLIRAVIQYDKDGEIPELSGMVQMAFSFIKTNLDIDRAKYEERCEKNRENAIARWKKVKEELEVGNANAYFGMRIDAKNADTDTVTDTENENDTVTATVTETETEKEESDRRRNPEKELIKLYCENVGQASGTVRREIKKWLGMVDESLLAYAINQAGVHDKKTWAYVGGILDSHYQAGRRDGPSAEKASKNRKSKGESPPRYDFKSFEENAIRR